jgi:hypothetical protein
MRLASYDPQFRGLVRAMAVNLGRLDKEQGRIARGNARHEVRLQARRLLALMDKEYPNIAKPKLNIGSDTREGRRTSPEAQTARWRLKMKRRGWGQVGDGWKLARIAEAKAPLQRPPIRWGHVPNEAWTPLWALLAIESVLLSDRRDDRVVVARIREASKSLTRRKALLAGASLTGSPLLQRGPGTP